MQMPKWNAKRIAFLFTFQTLANLFNIIFNTISEFPLTPSLNFIVQIFFEPDLNKSSAALSIFDFILL